MMLQLLSAYLNLRQLWSYEVCDEIDYPRSIFNDTAVQIWEWIYKFHHPLHRECDFIIHAGIKINPS